MDKEILNHMNKNRITATSECEHCELAQIKSKAEAQIEAIRAAMERYKNAPPHIAFDAVYDLRGDIEKILGEGK